MKVKASAQEKQNEEVVPGIFNNLSLNTEKAFKPNIAFETWGTYNIAKGENASETANRFDVSFRRLRLGASGNPYPWLNYTFYFYMDRQGEDDYAFTKGSYGGIGIWNAFITAKLFKDSDLLNLHAGYFWAAVSREYNTSPWAVSSYDKTQTAWYLRNFVTGKGNGIESGIALGGLKNFEGFGMIYRIGTYEPQKYISAEKGSRLFTGRIMFSIGEPEQNNYKYMLSGNQWGKRKGVTFGFGASTQSNGALTDTSFWNNSSTFGADILIDYKSLRIDGEYFFLKRTAGYMNNFNGTEFHFRGSYLINFHKTFVEPSFTYQKYDGDGNKSLYKYIGIDETYDFGVNWYLDKQKLKLALHYVLQQGSLSAGLGDYIGVACQIKL